MPELASKAVGYVVEGGIATITLCRPEVMNALDASAKRELLAALVQAERDAEVRCVVLTGEGKAFCSGQDLQETPPTDADGTRHLAPFVREAYNPIIHRIRELPKPVIAAVNGVAAGAGANLALACDLRLAADNAVFVQAFVKIGLVPDSGGTWFLPRLVGLARAAELMFLGEKVLAQEALAIGLVNRVIPADQLMSATMELASRLAQAPTRAIALTKWAMNRSLSGDLDEALEREAQAQELAGRTEDFREGVKAFQQKRPPVFRGR